MRARTLLPFLCSFALFLLTACGGGGGDAAQPPPMAGVQGLVVKDAVSGCDVRVCEIDPATGAAGATVLGEGRSATGGSFGFDFLAAPGGVYLAEGRGGTFENRATGLADGLGAFGLRGVFCVPAGETADANLTVLSTLVARRFEFLRTIRPLLAVKHVLRLARLEMALAFGLTDVRACPDPAGDDNARTLFLIDVGLVQMARDLGEPTAEVVHLFCMDLMDGRPDGFVCGEPGRFASGQAWSPSPLTLLGGAILLWLGSNPFNDTGMGPGDPIVAALTGRIDTWVVRGALAQLPRLLSLSKRFVTEQGGEQLNAHVAPYPTPEELYFEFRDQHDELLFDIAPTTFNTRIFGVHEYAITTQSIARGQVNVFVVDRTTGLFDVEPLGVLTPGLVRGRDVRPRRGIISGGSLVKIAGEGFDPDNPPEVRIGGKPARVERVLTPTCVRVFAPDGLPTGPVDVEVGGDLLAGAFEYVRVPPPVPLPEPDVRKLMLLIGGAGGGGGGAEHPRVLEGTLDYGSKTWELIEYRAGPTGGAFGPPMRGDFTGGGPREPTFEVVTDDIVLDSGRRLHVEPVVDGGMQGLVDLITLTVDVPAPGERPEVGFGVMYGAGGTAPRLRGVYDVTGTCIEDGVRTLVRGQATFRADGRVFVSGSIVKRTDGGREAIRPLLALARFTEREDGAFTIDGLPSAAGLSIARGFTSADGSSGTVVLQGPGKLIHLLLSARRVAQDVPLDDFGPDAASLLGRMSQPIEDVVSFRTSTQIADGQSVMLGGLTSTTHDVSGGTLEQETRVQAQHGYVSFHGRTADPAGRETGRLGERTAVQWDPLPPDGLDAAGTTAGSGLGYGLRTAGNAAFTVQSWRGDYKVLAMGIELEPDATLAPNPEHRSVMELGCLVRETDEIDVDGFTYSLAAKLRWDRLKRKEVDRDAGGVVSTSISGPSSESGFALVAAGGEFYAFACPLPPEGTKCFFRGCFSRDGSIGIARSSRGFGAPWHAVLMRKPEAPPRVDGVYNTRFFCHTFDGGGTAYAINGSGTYTFDGGAGTYVQDTGQIATSETLATVPSGPDVYPGTFTVDGEGCIDMTTDFGGGFTSDLCGAVHENGSVIVTMDPEPAAINCFTMYTLRDAAGAPDLAPASEKFCGLELDFDGSGGITAATRFGKLALGTSTLERSLGRVTWSNITPAVTTDFELLAGVPLTLEPGRTFLADLALGRTLFGARSPIRPIVGIQGEEGTAAPAGSFGVTLRREK